MKHEELRDRVSLLLDKELDSEERRRLEQYVATDPEARRQFEQIRAVWAMLDEHPPLRTSDRLGVALMARVREERRLARRQRLVRLTVGWAAAAALFLGVFLGLPRQSASDDGVLVQPTELSETYSRYAASRFDFEDF